MVTTSVNKSDHWFGNPEADIVLLVYVDYQCENCNKAFLEFKELREHLNKETCLVYRHFPFTSMHPLALPAALVIEACALQNKFLEAHNLIFERQEYLEYGLGGILRLLEKEHGVSIKQLNEDLKKEELKRKIDSDVESGRLCGVKKTPALFINGKRYAGIVEFEPMAKTIEGALAKELFAKRPQPAPPMHRSSSTAA